MWCDLRFFKNSHGNKAAVNLCPRARKNTGCIGRKQNKYLSHEHGPTFVVIRGVLPGYLSEASFHFFSALLSQKWAANP